MGGVTKGISQLADPANLFGMREHDSQSARTDILNLSGAKTAQTNKDNREAWEKRQAEDRTYLAQKDAKLSYTKKDEEDDDETIDFMEV